MFSAGEQQFSEILKIFFTIPLVLMNEFLYENDHFEAENKVLVGKLRLGI